MTYALKILTAYLAFCGLAQANNHALASQTTAKTLYVALTGGDKNTGGLSSPLKTISKAASLSGPGTTIYVEGGTYNEAVTISTSGSASSPINFMPYNGQKVILNGSNLASGKDVVDIYGSYINFSGFEVEAGQHGIVAYATHYVTISGNLIHGNMYAGIWVGGDTVGQSGNNTIENNTVYNNSIMNQARTLTGGWAQGISAIISDDTNITGNTVYGNYGEGIGTGLDNGVTILNNVVYDNYSVNIYLDNAPTSIVNANLSYCTGNTATSYKGHSPIAISAAIEANSSFQLPLSGVIITNNIDVDCYAGFYYGDYGYGGGMQNATIANNDFVNETYSAIHIDYDAKSSGNIVANNIFFNGSGTVLSSGSSSGFTFSNNDWYIGAKGGLSGASDTFANPMFSDPGSFVPQNYTLPVGSPAIGEGVSLPNVPNNFFGMPRSGPFNAGAI